MKRKVIFMTILSLFLVNVIYANSDYSTKVYIKDIGFDNQSIDGFKYVVIDREGNKIPVTNISKGINEVTLTRGHYKVVEVETPARYVKSKDLDLIIPVSQEGKVVSELSIYPKHYPNHDWDPYTPGSTVPKYGDKEDKPKDDNPSGDSDLGKREWEEKSKPNTPDNTTKDKIDVDGAKKTGTKEDKTDISYNSSNISDKTKKQKYTKTGFSESNVLSYIQIALLASIIVYLYLSRDKKRQ